MTDTPEPHPADVSGMRRLTRRLRTSPWMRLGLVAVALAFCAYGLVAQRETALDALRHLHWYSLVAAVAAAIAGLGFMMAAWRSLLATLGSPLPLTAATRVMFVGQLGKYVPGMVWAFAAQVELARECDIPRRRSATATVVSMAVTLATGLLTAMVALPLASRAAAQQYWWVLAAAPFLLIGLYPPLLGAALGRVLAIARRPPLERRIGAAGLARAVAWSALGWACFSLHMWLLVGDITGRGPAVLLASAGAYALAWSAGFLLVIFPSGVGPRELALIAALAPVLPRGSAIVVALASRVVMTAGDLACAGLGFAIGRRRPRSPQSS
jgi:glycosyltransferase 2 family protein